MRYTMAFFLITGSCLGFLAAETPDDTQAIQMSLDLLGKAARGHVENKTCFACHNQAFAMLSFSLASSSDFKVAKDEIKSQEKFTLDFLELNKKRFEEGKGTGGAADTAGWALWTLEHAQTKPSPITTAVIEYLLQHQESQGYWKATSNRPPSEASHFTTNYLALRALRVWGIPSQKAAIDKRKEKSLNWVIATPAKDHEDRVFKLLCLKELKQSESKLKQAAAEIIETQHPDGGWAQTRELQPDAYATGTALMALYFSGQLTPENPVYKKGADFLRKTRRPDGSWLVKSRSKPFQAYYESGFPHGKDQFISVTASGWATAALITARGK